MKKRLKEGNGILYYNKNDKFKRKNMKEIGKMIIPKVKV